VTTWDHKPALRALCSRLLTTCFAVPERLKKSEWAEKRRRMSAEASSQRGGRFSFDLAPWQREIIDADDDHTVGKVVGMMASQVTGKTETVNNIIGATIDIDPCPMLMVQPNEKPMAEAWSKDRLATMIRDTPVLRAKIRDPRSRDSGNTLLHKCFPGGHITVAGANSPASLASRPIRKVFGDEVDRFPASAGTEGDPIMLAEKRTESYADAVIYLFSTPTIKGASRIEKEFEDSDKRQWFCPCPVCGHWQTLKWEQVDWSTHGTVDDPRYICTGEAKCVLTDAQRQAMVRAGEWRATAPFKGIRGYHINGIYCLFKPKRRFKTRLAQMVADFLSANAKGTETLKVWVNTFKAETWEDPSEKPPEARDLLERCENYLSKNDAGEILLPEGVLVIGVGGDTQSDRVELEFVGYGHGEQSWGLGNVIVAGNPELPETWERVDAELQRDFIHPSGAKLRAACVLIDRKFKGKWVDDFTRPRNGRRVYSCYGSSVAGQPIAAALTRQGPRRTPAFRVGTDTAKGILHSRLKITRPGPRYMHFPEGFGYDLEYFEQLTGEREQTTWEQGKVTRKWVKTRPRNEALDKRVYALAAHEILRPNYDALAKNLEPATKRDYELKDPEQKKPEPAPQPTRRPTVARPVRRVGGSGGFVGAWK
jgi:phage terminase large subunit GpA-like protein